MNLNEVWQKAWALYQNKKFVSALNQLKVLDVAQEDATVSFVMAQCFWQIGQYKKAIKSFSKAFELDHSQVQYSLALVKALIAQNKKSKAKKILTKALSMFANNQELKLYKTLLEDINVEKLQLKNYITLFNNREANQNVINLCLACRLFRVNQYQSINEDEYNLYKDLSSFESYQRVFDSQELVKLVSFPKDLLLYSLKQATLNGHIIEAGVYFGQSINIIAKQRPNQTIYGFDSFEGLPEDWNENEKSGSYSTFGDLPKIKKNVKLIPGWFNKTLAKFINEKPAPISFLHVDCDIYSSTKDILNSLSDYIVKGTVILFDDFFGFKGYENHEWKALNEFINETGKNVEFLAFCPLGRELAVKVIS